MRIGIFGGSFNPIHNGHIHLASYIAEKSGLDEIWLMVSPQNPLKREDGLLDDTLRLQMAAKAIEGVPRLKASGYEFNLPKPSYTCDTLRSLSKDYPYAEFVLIIGADNWAVFDKWRDYREIIATHDIIIYPRPGYPVDTGNLPPNVILTDARLIDISSTEIRRKARTGESVSGLVPDVITSMVTDYYGNGSMRG